MNDVVTPAITDVAAYVRGVGEAARDAARALARAATQAKNAALIATATALRASAGAILKANARDAAAPRAAGHDPAFGERLGVRARSNDAMARGPGGKPPPPDSRGQNP